uniref:Uncharacterized protein n=1 Tax=Panagrolaimus sp. PS1159 TaxID=55785 RepID=A0AC35GAU1_9BILA
MLGMRKAVFFFALYTIIAFSMLFTNCNGYVILRVRPGSDILPKFEHIGNRQRRNHQLSEDRLRRSGIRSHMLKQPILGMSQWWNNDHDQETLNYYY